MDTEKDSTQKTANILLSAIDSLSFRDALPNSTGESGLKRSVFPPAPSVFYGLLRHIFIVSTPASNNKDEPNEQSLKTLIDQSLTKVKIKTIAYWADNYFALPTPYDCFNNEEGERKMGCLLVDASPPLGNGRFKNAVQIPDDFKTMESLGGRSFLNLDHYNKYLSEETLAKPILFSDVFSSEHKIGLKRNNDSRTAEDGMLYKTEMLDFKQKNGDTLFYIEAEGMGGMPANGLSRFGAEGKSISWKTSEQPIEITFPLKPVEKGEVYFKIVLATPAIFDGGTLPSWVSKGRNRGFWMNEPTKALKKFASIYVRRRKMKRARRAIKKFLGIKAELIGFCGGKPQAIGGYDIQGNSPKALYMAVPAGSVYYFKAKNGLTKEQTDILETQIHACCISDINPKQGFGLAFVGRCHNVVKPEPKS